MHGLVNAFKSFRMILSTLSLYIGFLNIFYLTYLLKGKKANKSLESYVGKFFSKKVIIIICQIIFIFGIVLSPVIYSKFENTNIGSFFEKETYSEQYYIYLRKNTNQEKSYRLKADILKGHKGYLSYTDEGKETLIITGNGYFIKKAYWNNGGYLVFIEDYEDYLYCNSSKEIFLGKECAITDYHGDTYYITLTAEKVNS